tara:strand:- start:294 stop:887 length:594 start_codon:yes stop_codon:yes gene_type:complete
MKKKIILIGAGGHAESCIDVIESTNKYKIIGLVGTKSELGKKVCGYKVILEDENIVSLKNKKLNAIVTIGQLKSAIKRKYFYNLLIKNNLMTPKIVSPMAYVSKFSNIGNGTIIMHGAVVNANVEIGSNCIINSNALLEHGVKIGNNCHISTSTTLNGEVKIEDEVFIGSGCILKQKIKIKKRSFIQMGSKLHKNYR